MFIMLSKTLRKNNLECEQRPFYAYLKKRKKRTNVGVFCSASLFASYTENQWAQEWFLLIGEHQILPKSLRRELTLAESYKPVYLTSKMFDVWIFCQGPSKKYSSGESPH